jgi:hypothetical protein
VACSGSQDSDLFKTAPKTLFNPFITPETSAIRFKSEDPPRSARAPKNLCCLTRSEDLMRPALNPPDVVHIDLAPRNLADATNILNPLRSDPDPKTRLIPRQLLVGLCVPLGFVRTFAATQSSQTELIPARGNW